MADVDGGLVLVNRRIEEMFGYDEAELLNRLITGGPQGGHRGQQASYPSKPGTWPPETRMRQAALRKDGTTFPAEISLSLLATKAGEFTMAMFREVTENRREDPALVTATANPDRALEFHDSVVNGLFEVGLALQAAAESPAPLVRQRVLDAAVRLDETIGEIREYVLAARTQGKRRA